MGSFKSKVLFGAFLVLLYLIVSVDREGLENIKLPFFGDNTSTVTNPTYVLSEVEEEEQATEYAMKTQELAQAEAKQINKNSLYGVILDALLNQKREINVGRYSLDSEEVFATREKVLEDFPEIFYFNHEHSYFSTDGMLQFNYKYSKKDIEEHSLLLKGKVNEIISTTIRPGMSDLEKIIELHDYVVLQTAYDYENYLNGTVPELSYTSYGALVHGVAVCDGYTKAMNLLLREVGIESKYVIGTGNGDAHSWNLVFLDGNWYHLDATWNDPVPNRDGQVAFSYFLVPDEQLAKDHTWNRADYPQAVSHRFSYFEKMESATRAGNEIFYTDDQGLYSIKVDGTGNRVVAPVRAYYIAVDGDWIYFSNYSHAGYLARVKNDGSQLTTLNDIHSTDIAVEGGKIYFTDASSEQRYYMEVEK